MIPHYKTTDIPVLFQNWYFTFFPVLPLIAPKTMKKRTATAGSQTVMPLGWKMQPPKHHLPSQSYHTIHKRTLQHHVQLIIIYMKKTSPF